MDNTNKRFTSQSCFNESDWCMSEAHEAIDSLKIIPLLLHPIEDEKFPIFLKRYRYIDAQKEEDVPAKIMDAYYHSEAVKRIVKQGEQELTAEEIKNQNGARLMSKTFIQQKPYRKKGYVFETGNLTNREREYLKSIHEKCEQQFEAAATLVSSQCLLKFYKIFALTKLTHAAAVLLGAIAVSSTMTLQYMAVLVSRDNRNMSKATFPFALFLGFALYIFFVLGTIVSRRKLMLIRYNTAPCQEYVNILLNKKEFHLDQDELKNVAAAKIEEKLEQLQCLGLLAEWFQLGVYDYNRHNTWLRKQCLCQLLEGNLIQRKVITV